MSTKKKKNWFKIIILSLFIVYIGLYALNTFGYYDAKSKSKVELTNEQIKKFEEDVKNGENVEIKDYLKNQEIDYTNGVSKMGYKISSNVNKIFNEGISQIIKILSKLLS